jgi:hypothetical protein
MASTLAAAIATQIPEKTMSRAGRFAAGDANVLESRLTDKPSGVAL